MSEIPSYVDRCVAKKFEFLIQLEEDYVNVRSYLDENPNDEIIAVISGSRGIILFVRRTERSTTSTSKQKAD